MAWFAEALWPLAYGYMRMSRWSKAGVLDRVFEKLQVEQIVRIKLEAVSLDSTSIKVHPDGTGALKKNGSQAIGKSRGGWNTKIHMVAADARTAIIFALSPGNAYDAPEGRELLWQLPHMPEGLPMLMDRAYEGDETRQLVFDLGIIPVVPPKSNLVWSRGPTTAHCIKSATRSSGSSANSKDSAESFRDLRNLTCSSLGS